jgi:hypothetical protein
MIKADGGDASNSLAARLRAPGDQPFPPQKTPFYFNELIPRVNEKICTRSARQREQPCQKKAKSSMDGLPSDILP